MWSIQQSRKKDEYACAKKANGRVVRTGVKIIAARRIALAQSARLRLEQGNAASVRFQKILGICL